MFRAMKWFVPCVAAFALLLGLGVSGVRGEEAKKETGSVSGTVLDKDGKFSMADVPVGKYVVMAMVKGVGGARSEVEVTAGSEAKVELKLQERPAKGAKKGDKKADSAAE